MTHDVWDQRRRGLEEGFFAKHNQKLLEDLVAHNQKEASQKELAQATGFHNLETLSKLLDAGIKVETLAAVNLVPLVHVAWCDHELSREERRALLKAAEDKGIHTGSPSHQLLSQWLEHEPGTELFSAWQAFVASCRQQLPDQDFRTMQDEVVNLSKDVAKAAGGILGINATSDAEKRALQDIASAFNA